MYSIKKTRGKVYEQGQQRTTVMIEKDKKEYLEKKGIEPTKLLRAAIRDLMIKDGVIDAKDNYGVETLLEQIRRLENNNKNLMGALRKMSEKFIDTVGDKKYSELMK